MAVKLFVPQGFYDELGEKKLKQTIRDLFDLEVDIVVECDSSHYINQAKRIQDCTIDLKKYEPEESFFAPIPNSKQERRQRNSNRPF